MAGFAAGIGAMIAGIFGMNLKSTLEESIIGFWGTTAAIVLGCFWIFVALYKYTCRRRILWRSAVVELRASCWLELQRAVSVDGELILYPQGCVSWVLLSSNMAYSHAASATHCNCVGLKCVCVIICMCKPTRNALACIHSDAQVMNNCICQFKNCPHYTPDECTCGPCCTRCSLYTERNCYRAMIIARMASWGWVWAMPAWLNDASSLLL